MASKRTCGELIITPHQPRAESCHTTTKDADHLYLIKPKQNDALSICRITPGTLVFAMDIAKGEAKKKFLVAGFKAFWKSYSAHGARRCHYEVIQVDQPCKFYMDVDVELNEVPADFNGRATIADLKRIVALHFQLLLDIDIDDPDVRVFELDSSNEKKFSRHMIWDLGARRAFATNADCGAFYRHVERYIIEHYGAPESNRFWFAKVGKASKVPTPMADATVYTKLRNFRIYASSKLGQNRYLNRIDSATGNVASSVGTEALYASDRDFLRQSMIQVFESKPTALLRVNEPNGESAIYTSSTWFAMNRKNMMYERGTLSFASEAQKHLARISAKLPSSTTSTKSSSGRICYNSFCPESGAVSDSDAWSDTAIPRIVVDFCMALHESLKADLQPAGQIQYYYWYPESMTCVCQFSGHYCFIANRMHSTNHAKLKIIFRSKTPRYMHTCHSASCPDSNLCDAPTALLLEDTRHRLDALQSTYRESSMFDFRTLFGVLVSSPDTSVPPAVTRDE